MSILSPDAALNKIITEFSKRGWQKSQEIGADLIRRILEAGGSPDARALAASVPVFFLSANRIGRLDLERALQHVLAGVRVEGPTNRCSVVHVHGDQVMSKRIVINNQGQMAANVDSPKGRVRVGRQQQVQVTKAQESALREHLSDPEVHTALALPLSDDEKAHVIGGHLAKVARVSLDVAVDFASKFIAEMIRPK